MEYLEVKKMAHVITYEEILSNGDFEYTNNKGKNFDNVLKYLDAGQLDYSNWTVLPNDRNQGRFRCSNKNACELFKGSILWFTGKPHSHCVCSEPILYENIAVNKRTGQFILVGSTCIQKLGEETYKLHLRMKNEAEGKKYCEHCDRCIRKDIVERAIERGDKYFYHVGCEEFDNKNKKEPPPPPYTPPQHPTISTETIVKFGKYKGQPLSNLIQDRGYMKWIVLQEETTGHFRYVQEFIKNSNLIV